MSAQSRTGNANKRTVCRNARVIASRGPGFVLPALAVLGMGGPASALELGPAQVQSALGQPLRASIAFALRPFEEVAPYCIRVTRGRSASGLPSGGPASVTLRDGTIYVAGEAPVSEPLIALQLTVDCPYAPHLSREYVVFVDPEQPVAATATSPVATSAPARREPAAARASAAVVQTTPIAAGANYRVQRGDTLSGIAERLSGRRVGLWDATELLFASNPEAFIDADPDRLRAGALLRIPDAMYAAQTAPAVQPKVPEASGDVAPVQISSAYTGYVPDAPTVEPPETASVPGRLFRDGSSDVRPREAATVTNPFEVADEATVDASPAVADSSPRPGDVLVEAEGLFVSPIEVEDRATPAGAAPEAEAAAAVAPKSAVPGASSSSGSGAWSWLLWLGGSGVALILGLLLFGRTLKSRFGRRTLAPGDAFARRGAGEVPESDAQPEVHAMNVDFRLDEADAEARIVRVDVDLDDGSAFQETGDIDVAQDFGFSASGGLELGLDIDFSDEAPAMVDVTGRSREGDVIVEEEIPPVDSTGEYDVSMIVDATRQPLADTEDTAKDLHAIELASTDAAPEEDPFTLSGEVDYKILEQDYEEELTATQALSVELSRAARDLVDRLGDESDETAVHDLPTVEMPAPGTELTAELPRAGSGHADPSATAEMLPESALVDGRGTDVNENLALIPDAGNDASADMEAESATVDTKKLRVS